jgi:hypothetical protein
MGDQMRVSSAADSVDAVEREHDISSVVARSVLRSKI